MTTAPTRGGGDRTLGWEWLYDQPMDTDLLAAATNFSRALEERECREMAGTPAPSGDLAISHLEDVFHEALDAEARALSEELRAISRA